MKEKQYIGVLTEIGQTASKLQNFSNGYATEGVFTKLPKAGEVFWMTPTSGEFKFGYFHTSRVVKITRRKARKGRSVLKLETLNSIYELVYTKE